MKKDDARISLQEPLLSIEVLKRSSNKELQHWLERSKDFTDNGLSTALVKKEITRRENKHAKHSILS